MNHPLLGRASLLLMTLGACAPQQRNPVAEGMDPDVLHAVPETYALDAPARVVFLGDSITAGVGAEDIWLSYPRLLLQNDYSRWPQHRDADLRRVFPGMVESIHLAKDGAQTSDLYNHQLDELERRLPAPVEGPTLIVMTIGGNDVARALNPLANASVITERTLNNFEAIIERLQDPTWFPDGVFIYATNVYDPTDGMGQANECFFGLDFSARVPDLHTFNDRLADLAVDMDFALVDLHGHFAGHGFNNWDPKVRGYDASDATEWFKTDCLHPNTRGHHEVRRLFHAAITDEPLRLERPGVEFPLN